MINAHRLIDVLERANRDHYSERSGLQSCDALMGMGYACNCGADEINAEIDALVAELKDSIGLRGR